MLFTRSSKIMLILLAVWLVLFSSIRNLSVPDEGRYGDISRWMVESGDWLIPRMNGLPFFHKPPLLHWLSSGLMEIFGVHIWVLRLVPVGAAITILISMFWFLKKYVNENTAQISVLVLATSLLFYGSSQYINHDLLVACWISVAIFSFADFILSRNYKSLFLGYAACGLGFLSKGLIGILIPGMILLPWILVIGAWRNIPALLNPFAILLLLAIVLPWPLLVEHRYPGFFHYFFVEQQFNRFSSAEFNNKQPWMFYLVCLFVSFFPWLLLSKFKVISSNHKDLLGRPIFVLMIIWTTSCIIFFSIPPSKLAGYILPATAPLAILIAATINQINSGYKLAAVQRWGAIVFLAVFAIFLLIAPFIHVYSKTQSQSAHFSLMIGLFLILIVSILIYLTFKHRVSALLATLIVSLSLCMSLTAGVRVFDKKSNADQMLIKSLIDNQANIIFYNQYYYDVPFLLDTRKIIYIVGDWSNVNGDSTSRQLKDGLRFEPLKGKYLIDKSKFDLMLKSGQKLVVFSDKGALDKYLNKSSRVDKLRNFEVYQFN